MNRENSQNSEILVVSAAVVEKIRLYFKIVRGVWCHAIAQSQLSKPHYFRPL